MVESLLKIMTKMNIKLFFLLLIVVDSLGIPMMLPSAFIVDITSVFSMNVL